MAEVKKKIKPGAMELHPEELAILVNYEVQEVSIDGAGNQQILSRESTSKKITVKSLNEGTNVPLLAKEIVDKCKLIHPSKVGTVEDLLYQLQQRLGGGGMAASPPPPQPRAPAAPQAPPAEKPKRGMIAPRKENIAAEEAAEMRARQQQQASQIFKVQQKQYDPAYLNELDSYIEDLYEEDMAKKIRATGMIAQLFRQTENFEHLLSHETLLQTLARLMREEMKRSIDLCINIVSVFFSVSNFSQFHQVIMDNQVGALTMDLIDLEIKRTEHRAAEEGISPAMVAQKALDAASGAVQLNDREKKLLALIQKQDRLLYLCFYMLLNLAEDVGVERKMKKKNIVVYLVKMLDRSNVELLILATTFLKKMSIYKENKEKMSECRIVDKLAKYVPVRNDVLLMSVLRLLHNLSFDSVLRDAMVKNGLIPKAVELMAAPRFQPVVLGLLYHISMDDKFKSMFTYTECLPRLYEMLARVQDLRNTPELIALAVNLTQNGRNAEVLCEGDRFDRLIRRAFQTCDELMFKVMRNLAQQESLTVKRRFGPYIEQMVQLLKSQDVTAELFVEVLGCLANLYIPEFDFFQLVRKHDLLRFLATYAQPGAVDDDILLEVVMFVGVLCNEGTAPMLVDSGLVNILFQLMGEKKEDDEFVLQIAFAFNKFMMYDMTRTALLGQTQVVFYLVDLLQDKNKEVRRVADQCLDVIMDTDEEWAVRIRNLKFESFNQEWLDVVAAPPDDGHGHPGMRGGYGHESGELDYSGMDGAGDYTIGGQRVVADFDEFQGGAGGQGYSGGGAYDDYGGDGEGQYDQEEMMRGYAM
uniref:Kinesin-associated protein n=1 Tax=Chlamydomonas leiostraca TaxID=1034604 RepID=A0A7S0RCX9_9CHLO|mmetsp:Transcript_19387/g.49330  ORF Transcript_19387/g.49330 Transcript_19387/m.49330 type:complete len:812 (+) Transcript_19387:190-2625(+)|eukprot:CAMPEP_0202872032 /NCGR_PEP_ID=MMETSP1391-20130828/20230_1 /ASSEMBLY_ACC=CAM_ASM_000867 /TAXON_ID=1034604 /ORGANISM="Chlamydomonas leiostraca, Strain SAG 11-49" /LENGTH=811 /DNA_ID=CAMNT_0049552979 /DNA_START=126 /DNA_END=2561 /DNA_ORIENTATION=+